MQGGHISAGQNEAAVSNMEAPFMMNGRYFLNLDGGAFEVVLECLRTGRRFKGKDFGVSQTRVVEVARALGLQEVVEEKEYI